MSEGQKAALERADTDPGQGFDDGVTDPGARKGKDETYEKSLEGASRLAESLREQKACFGAVNDAGGFGDIEVTEPDKLKTIAVMRDSEPSDDAANPHADFFRSLVTGEENKGMLVLSLMTNEELEFDGEEGAVKMHDENGNKNPLFFFLLGELSGSGLVQMEGIDERFKTFLVEWENERK